MYEKVGTRKFTRTINKLINTFTQGNTSNLLCRVLLTNYHRQKGYNSCADTDTEGTAMTQQVPLHSPTPHPICPLAQFWNSLTMLSSGLFLSILIA